MLYCHQCGTEIFQKARFCPNCGIKLVDGDSQSSNEENQQIIVISDYELNENTEENIENSDHSRIVHKKQSKAISSLLPILLPFISFLFVSGGVGAYYSYEKNINSEVLKLQEIAEVEALHGNYLESSNALKKAMEMRKGFEILSEDLQIIKIAASYSDSLKKIDDYLEKQQFGKASQELTSLTEKLTTQTSPLFDSFRDKIAEKNEQITVGKVKNGLKDANTVDELTGKLSSISGIKTKEATALKEQILVKIAAITIDKAKTQLNKKKYSESLSTIDKALQYATNDQNLLTFKEKVIKEQNAFEQAEQERIEQAMVAAAKEDLLNRTAAVNVTTFEVTLDEYGDVYIYGEVENVATTVIDSITVYYTVYDLNGNVIGEDFTTVYPSSLEPDETGTFEAIYYGITNDVNVEVDNITWYLE